MKKILALCLSIVMLLSLSTTVFAAEYWDESAGNGQTEIKAHIYSSYTITIPATIDLSNGEQGEVMAKVMKTLVMYGETFGAERMVPVTSEKGHLVTSFGLKMMTPVFDLMDQLLNAGVTSKQKFSVDPKPFDPAVPSDFLKNFVFKKFYKR